MSGYSSGIVSLNDQTLDTIHKEQIEKMRKHENSVEDLTNEIEKNKILLSDQMKMEISDRDHHLVYELKKKNTELQKQIDKIPEEYNDYFLKNGELLYKYEKKKTTMNVKKVSIKNIFKKKKGVSSKVTSTYKKYLANVDPSYVYTKKEYITNENYCTDCKKHRIQDSTEARMICEDCGSEVPIILYAEKPSMKDPSPDVRYYEYKRFGHFCDWLCNLQGNGNQVDNDIIEAVRYEINRARIKDLNTVTEKQVKGYLKKYKNLGYDKYSNQVTQILYRATGIEQISIPSKIIEDLKTLFPLIQDSWEKHKPKDRTNFSSYSYIIYKFCQLLDYDGLKNKLKLLKDKYTIYKLDLVWKKICKDMGGKEKGWTFIPTY